MQHQKHYDVIIIGAGPSGSSAAAFCAIKGLKTLLLDKQQFPREKICGDALSGKSVHVLEQLNLIPKIEKSSHALIAGVIFSGPNGEDVDISFEKSNGANHGFCIRRKDSDNILFQNAKRLCDVIEGFEVTGIEYSGDRVLVKGLDKNMTEEEGQDKEFRASLILGADGAYSVVAKAVSLNQVDYEHHCTGLRTYYKGVKGKPNRIELHFIDEVIPGYFWIFPMGNDEWNVGVGMITKDMQDKKVKLNEVLQSAIQSPKFRDRFKDAQQLEQYKGWTLPFGSKKRVLHANRTLLLGDAAQLIDPFTGEGQGNALMSGMIAAEVAAEAKKAGKFDAQFLEEYDRRIYTELWPELSMSYNLQKMSRNKWLLNLVMGKAARSDKVRGMITAMLSGQKSKENFFNPLFYLELLLS